MVCALLPCRRHLCSASRGRGGRRRRLERAERGLRGSAGGAQRRLGVLNLGRLGLELVVAALGLLNRGVRLGAEHPQAVEDRGRPRRARGLGGGRRAAELGSGRGDAGRGRGGGRGGRRDGRGRRGRGGLVVDVAWGGGVVG